MNKKEKNKTIRTFGIASFLNDMGADMVYSIWPLFLIFLGASKEMIGLIDGLGDSIVSLSKAGAGYLSDRIRKRKAFIWFGYTIGGLSRIGYALSSTWQAIIPLRIFDRFGKIRDAPRDAIVAEYSVKKEHGRKFGFLNFMDNLGATCGIIIASILIATIGISYRNLFLLAAIPGLLAAIVIFFGIKEKRKSIRLYKGISFKQIDWNTRLFTILSAIFALGAFSYSFLLIFASEYGFRNATIPLLYLTFVLVASLSSIPLGRLSDKIGRKNTLAISFALWGIVTFSFIYLTGYLAIILIFVVYGLHLGSLTVVQKAFVSELAPKKYKASVLGGFQMVIGLAALPASLLAGYLWQNFGKFAPFYLSIVLTLISLILLVFVKEK